MENITLHKFPKLVDLKLLSMSAGLWGLANGIVYFSLPLYILHNNGSLQDVGIVLSLQWVPVLLLQPFTKEIIQTFGNKLVIVNGCLIRAVSVVCLIYSLSLSNDLAVYFICSILTLLTRLTDVALDTLVIENTTVDDRPIIESYIQSSETFGLVVAPAIGGVAITYFSFVHMFILAFFLFLFSSLMSLYIFRKTFIIQTRKTLKNRPNPHKIYMWFIIDLIEITRNNATVRYFGLLNLSINIFAGLLAALHPYIMSTYYKLDAAFYGIVNSSAAILGFIALAIGGKVITSMGYKRVFHYSWMLLSISILLMIMAKGYLWSYILGYCMFYFIVQLHNIASRSKRSEFYDQNNVVKYVVYFQFLSLFGHPVGSSLISIFDTSLSEIAMIVSLLIFILSVFLCRKQLYKPLVY